MESNTTAGASSHSTSSSLGMRELVDRESTVSNANDGLEDVAMSVEEAVDDSATVPSPVQEEEQDAEIPTSNDTATEPSLPEDYLPVARLVQPRQQRSHPQPPPQQQQLMELPTAIPHDVEAEKRASRRQLCLVVSLVLVVAVGVVLGVTLGATSSNSNGEGPTGPSPSPTTLDFASLQQLVETNSLDGGTALNDTDSPQYQALTWLEGNANLDEYPDWKRIQRYVLMVLYYSTNGDEWGDNIGWASDEDECSWLSHETTGPVCNESGRYLSITLLENKLNGMLPLELALLSDSLCKFRFENVNGVRSLNTNVSFASTTASLNITSDFLSGTVPTEIGLLKNLGEYISSGSFRSNDCDRRAVELTHLF